MTLGQHVLVLALTLAGDENSIAKVETLTPEQADKAVQIWLRPEDRSTWDSTGCDQAPNEDDIRRIASYIAEDILASTLPWA
jgi:hypothetical protein